MRINLLNLRSIISIDMFCMAILFSNFYLRRININVVIFLDIWTAILFSNFYVRRININVVIFLDIIINLNNNTEKKFNLLIQNSSNLICYVEQRINHFKAIMISVHRRTHSNLFDIFGLLIHPHKSFAIYIWSNIM